MAVADLTPRTPGGSNHRQRLLEGMAAAVREKGFGGTTLADVVRHAGVSRRTFYEHFTDPVDCYLTLIEAIGDRMLDGVARAMAAEGDFEARIAAAVGVYLDLFAADPELSRSYWTELHLTGAAGRELTARMSRRTGEVLRALVADARRRDPSLAEIDADTGVMVAAGVRELALLAHDAGEPLDAARATSVELVRRVVGLPARTPPGS